MAAPHSDDDSSDAGGILRPDRPLEVSPGSKNHPEAHFPSKGKFWQIGVAGCDIRGRQRCAMVAMCVAIEEREDAHRAVLLPRHGEFEPRLFR